MVQKWDGIKLTITTYETIKVRGIIEQKGDQMEMGRPPVNGPRQQVAQTNDIMAAKNGQEKERLVKGTQWGKSWTIDTLSENNQNNQLWFYITGEVEEATTWLLVNYFCNIVFRRIS